MSLSIIESKKNYKIATSPKKNIYLDTNENIENVETVIRGNDIMPYFDMKKNKGGIRVFLSGGTGSGKSYMAKQIIKQIKPPKVYLFSSLWDGDYDDVKNITQIDLIDIMNTNSLNVHQIFELMEDDSCIIFDDIMSFGTKISKPYIELRTICLQKSRHKNQSILVCEQSAMLGAATRSILLNCNYYVCFPKNNYKSFFSLASNYLGLTKDKILEIQKLRSRYVMFSKNYPAYYISAIEVSML